MSFGSFYRRAAGTSLLLAACDDGSGHTVPVLLHWGADLGELTDEDVAASVAARVGERVHRDARRGGLPGRYAGRGGCGRVGTEGGHDASEAAYVIAAVATSVPQTPVPVQLPGLDRSRRYHVEQVGPSAAEGPRIDLGDRWLDGDPLLPPGSVLGSAGIRLPVMPPESARVLRLRAR